MPILKATDPLPERPVIVTLYGIPGAAKTSISNTSKNPILIDFDRGSSRSVLRKDVLVVNRWEDVLEEEQRGTFAQYDTVVIDTAKAALDDFLMPFVINKDVKNARNKLAAYGAIGDEFKLFINNRRLENADIVNIAHEKEDKEGDVVRHTMDITGSSNGLILRISDQVGFLSIQNKVRSIQWDPTDTSIGKNVAKLPTTPVPSDTDIAFKTFLADIIAKVKTSIVAMSEAQQEAMAVIDTWTSAIAGTEDPAVLSGFVEQLQALNKAQSVPLLHVLNKRASDIGLVYSKPDKSFVPQPVKA